MCNTWFSINGIFINRLGNTQNQNSIVLILLPLIGRICGGVYRDVRVMCGAEYNTDHKNATGSRKRLLEHRYNDSSCKCIFLSLGFAELPGTT